MSLISFSNSVTDNFSYLFNPLDTDLREHVGVSKAGFN